MVYTAYLIITPDPGQDHYIQEPDGHYFYVKFGDGADNLSAYKRANPNFGFAENSLAPSERMRTHDQNAKPINPKIGKFLEWVYIRHIGFAANYEGTEWHRLRVKPGKSVRELSQVLQRMLQLFPTFDWGGVSQRAFENEINKAWDGTTNCAGEFDDIAKTYLDANGHVQRY